MLDQTPTVTGVICTDNETLRRALALLMHASGLRVLDMVDSIGHAIDVAQRSRPDLIVADIAALGLGGLSILPSVLEAAPRCALALVSPFPALAEAAYAAGATAVIDALDLRPLVTIMVGVRTQSHAGHVCTCCAPSSELSGSAAVFDTGSSTVSTLDGPEGLLWERPDGPGRGVPLSRPGGDPESDTDES